jgi:transcriptional regulator with XRE-family HTH domain
MLRDLRRSSGLTQAEAARRAGTSQSTWSYLEIGGDGRTTLSTWTSAATALGASFDAFVRGASAADTPRDAVHLRNQELVIRVSLSGGWAAVPEEPIDRRAGRLAQPTSYFTGVERWRNM